MTHRAIPRMTSRALATVAAMMLPASALPVAAAVAAGRVAWVTDGDTFGLASGERIRIVGIDAPETQAGNAKCRRELALGVAAAARARAVLLGRSVVVTRVGRSYDRTVARVRIDGRDLASELVRIGVARYWPRGTPKPDWCRVD